MRRISIWRPSLLSACLVLVAFLPETSVARVQDGPPASIVDGVVSAVCHKQIVLLGELPTHGEAHTFDAKSKIVDRLIAQCGFTAVLFEAPVYDFVGMERARGTGAATVDQLNNAMGRFWWTRELATWRRTLFDASVKKRVLLGGIDDQISITSHYAKSVLPRLVASGATDVAASQCRDVVSRHVGWTYDTKNPFDEREQERLQRCARNAAGTAVSNSAFDAGDRVMLDSFARYADRQRPGGASTRDESMFRNLVWYIERLPPNSRVVVWTATVHAARQRGTLPWIPIGARAVEKWADRVGSVGFTAYEGHTSMAGRPASVIPAAPADSLEALATKDSAWAVLNSARLRELGRVPSRLLGKFAADTWSDYFDAVVVIRQEVAPTFDPWK